MAEHILLLGADLGDPPRTFARATELITRRVGPVRAVSRDHWTRPWGFSGAHLFLNRALAVDSGSPPPQVMQTLLEIEQELGRQRPATGGYASRAIDIDILFIEGQVIDLPGLTVPHPRVHLRAFALGPAADIAPALVHPGLGRTVLQLLDQVPPEP